MELQFMYWLFRNVIITLYSYNSPNFKIIIIAKFVRIGMLLQYGRGLYLKLFCCFMSKKIKTRTYNNITDKCDILININKITYKNNAEVISSNSSASYLLT